MSVFCNKSLFGVSMWENLKICERWVLSNTNIAIKELNYNIANKMENILFEMNVRFIISTKILKAKCLENYQPI